MKHNNFKIPNFSYIFYDKTKSMKNKTKILNISESFNLTREALKGKQKQLKQQDKGNKPKRERSGQSYNTIFTI